MKNKNFFSAIEKGGWKDKLQSGRNTEKRLIMEYIKNCQNSTVKKPNNSTRNCTKDMKMKFHQRGDLDSR